MRVVFIQKLSYADDSVIAAVSHMYLPVEAYRNANPIFELNVSLISLKP